MGITKTRKKEKHMIVMVSGKPVELVLVRKRIKRMHMRTDGEKLLVSCPYGVSEAELMAFVRASEAWINNAMARQKATRTVNQEGIEGSELYWLGERKRIRYIPAARDKLVIAGNEAIFYLKEKTGERITKAFRKAAGEELLRMAARERGAWDEKICRAHGLPLPEIRTRHMTSRWGVCHIRTRQIVLSTRLIHYPPQGFSYVLLHEYAHFLVPDHSRNFYAVIAEFMPAYRQHMRVLKQFS